MKTGDRVFGAVMLVVLAALMMILFSQDSDDWDKQFNGCYVHSHHNNSVLHNNTTTKSLYCPSNQPVR